MKIYITFTKSKIIAIAAFIILVIVVAAQVSAAGKTISDGANNKSRLEFINSFGLRVEDIPQEKNITIPAFFSDVYANYNSLQKKAGFDLTEYKGKNATVYSYNEKNSDRIINLIVCDGAIVGGDITETALNGNMEPLIKD